MNDQWSLQIFDISIYHLYLYTIYNFYFHFNDWHMVVSADN